MITLKLNDTVGSYLVRVHNHLMAQLHATPRADWRKRADLADAMRIIIERWRIAI